MKDCNKTTSFVTTTTKAPHLREFRNNKIGQLQAEEEEELWQVLQNSRKFAELKNQTLHKKPKQRTKPKAPLQALIEKQMECNHNYINKTTTQRKCWKELAIVPKNRKEKNQKCTKNFSIKKNLEVHNFVNPKPSSLPFSRKDESFL